MQGAGDLGNLVGVRRLARDEQVCRLVRPADADTRTGREALGLDGAAGRIEREKLNVDGGAIGLGHPVGASGNRIVLHLVNAMKRLGVKQGIATECIGGGQGGAMLIETV
jgi:acetyl-CoA C-acetyltransferase